MNNELRVILDKILALSKDQLLSLASGSGADAETSELISALSRLTMGDTNTLLNEAAKAWGIDVSSLSGGSGDDGEAEEEDTSKLYEIIIKSLKDPAAKIKGTLALKNVIKTDPNWTLGFVKTGVDSLPGKPFIVPVSYQKADPELEIKLKEVRDAGFEADIKVKDA
jgi:hypothetical protein